MFINRKPKNSIQNRVVLFTVTCLIGMCIVVSLVSYYIFQNYLKHSLIQSTEASLSLLADSITSEVSDIYQFVRYCQGSKDIAEYIAQNPNPSSILSVETYDRFFEEYQNNAANSYIPRVAIVTNDHYLQVVNATFSSTTDLSAAVPELPYFDELLESSDYNFSVGFVKDPFYKSGKMVLPIIRPITYQFNSIQGGYLFLEVSADLFTNAIERYAIAEDSAVYLTLGKKNYRYENGSLSEIEPSYFFSDDLSDTSTLPGLRISETKNAEGKKLTMISAPLGGMPDCYISQNISLSELRNQRLLLWGILIITLISIIAIGVLLMLMLNRMISVPVSKIREKMQRVSQGDFSRDPSIEWEHELGEIGRGINNLSEDVNSLMERRLEDEKQKRDLEYKMLQSQINPHFLYNTLNSIKWMATIQGADGISEMTTSLAKLLKSISKGTSLLVPIREELSLLQDYFTIQSYRYGGTIAMEIKVDDETIYENQILKFTLQPLVENAIFHGIEPKGTGHILIHAYLVPCENAKPDIRIDVRDDGVGMSPEKTEEILYSNKENSADFFRELGVSNVHKRLQYEFGAAYGISIDSKVDEYTLMSIRIPSKSAPERSTV